MLYAPYRLLKSCGIKGPTPTPFFGNYREMIKMVWYSAYPLACTRHMLAHSIDDYMKLIVISVLN